MNWLQKIVTPAFITFNAHCWFAYAVVYTCGGALWAALAMAAIAAFKEFYVDKHYEVAQSFRDNLEDFGGYLTGIMLAVMVHKI
jgi:hypothetical protein